MITAPPLSFLYLMMIHYCCIYILKGPTWTEVSYAMLYSFSLMTFNKRIPPNHKELAKNEFVIMDYFYGVPSYKENLVNKTSPSYS